MDTRSRVLSRADRHDVDAVLDAARVDPLTGLDPAEAARRLAEVGRNALPETPRVTLGDQVITQLREPMAILLLVAAAVSGFSAATTQPSDRPPTPTTERPPPASTPSRRTTTLKVAGPPSTATFRVAAILRA